MVLGFAGGRKTKGVGPCGNVGRWDSRRAVVFVLDPNTVSWVTIFVPAADCHGRGRGDKYFDPLKFTIVYGKEDTYKLDFGTRLGAGAYGDVWLATCRKAVSTLVRVRAGCAVLCWCGGKGGGRKICVLGHKGNHFLV